MARTDLISATGNNKPSQQEIIEHLIKIAETEQKNGNQTITVDKLNQLNKYLQNDSLNQSKFQQKKLPKHPRTVPKFSPLLKKFKVKSVQVKEIKITKPELTFYQEIIENFTFKKIENIFVTILEMIGSLLDNLHLFSKLPMFPKVLNKYLKNTNKLWIIILIFLIRKTITQLLNVRRKQQKVKMELTIIKSQKFLNSGLITKYNKVLKDLSYDRMMLVIELVGNFVDLAFNSIEFYAIPLPDWFMNTLNFSSMLMAVYRMNKDDEYLNDDILEDLI